MEVFSLFFYKNHRSPMLALPVNTVAGYNPSTGTSSINISIGTPGIV